MLLRELFPPKAKIISTCLSCLPACFGWLCGVNLNLSL